MCSVSEFSPLGWKRQPDRPFPLSRIFSSRPFMGPAIPSDAAVLEIRGQTRIAEVQAGLHAAVSELPME
jgi:hypothetical protein